jgi:acyl carrier protein
MKKSEFFEELKDILEAEGIAIDENSKLSEVGTYDSMSIMSIVALVDDNFNKRLTSNQLKSVKTTGDLMKLVGLENFN